MFPVLAGPTATPNTLVVTNTSAFAGFDPVIRFLDLLQLPVGPLWPYPGLRHISPAELARLAGYGGA